MSSNETVLSSLYGRLAISGEETRRNSLFESVLSSREMLSCRLTTPLCRPKHVISSSRCGSSLSSCYSRPRLPSQTRAIFGSVKSRLKRWLGPERERIPLVPSGSAVLFSENNLWARAGPSEGSILIGLTEEAKVRLQQHEVLRATLFDKTPRLLTNSLPFPGSTTSFRRDGALGTVWRILGSRHPYWLYQILPS